MDIIIKTKKREIYVTPTLWIVLGLLVLSPIILFGLFAALITFISGIFVWFDLLNGDGHFYWLELLRTQYGEFMSWVGVVFDLLFPILVIGLIIHQISRYLRKRKKR